MGRLVFTSRLELSFRRFCQTIVNMRSYRKLPDFPLETHRFFGANCCAKRRQSICCSETFESSTSFAIENNVRADCNADYIIHVEICKVNGKFWDKSIRPTIHIPVRLSSISILLSHAILGMSAVIGKIQKSPFELYAAIRTKSRYRSSIEVSNALAYSTDTLFHASQKVVTISNDALKRILNQEERKVQDDSSGQGLGDDSSSKEPGDFLEYSDPFGDVSTRPANVVNANNDELMMMLKHFRNAGQTPRSDLFISSALFPSAASAFQNFFFQNCSSELKKRLQEMEPLCAREKILFPMFAKFCTREFPNEMERFKALVQIADLSKPHMWFPLARTIKRKIIYHHGPTNSGKTYNALQRFMQESSGIYCSPLRLLAMEVFDYCNSNGVKCSLHTGQEKKDVPFSCHVSCTIEMASMDQVWKVAVIDEVQLLDDDHRGWAWTRALLGLRAEEIHLCGDPSALNVVKNICFATGDELEEHSYKRFKPLAVDTKTLEGKVCHVQQGDCIVAFSRREIFEIKRAVENATDKCCCVVYGALPPETRAQQAKLFNDPCSGYDILVASDAVGMGLNLNIRRIVFYTLEKFDGEFRKPIPVSLVKQIAGRAGRRGSLYPEGVVTTFHRLDLPYLESCLEKTFTEVHSAGLFPMYQQLQLFAEHVPNASFSELLEQFAETCHVDGFYCLCQNKNLRRVASVIDIVKNLTLEERFIFCFSPVNVRSSKSIGALLQYATAYSRKLPLPLPMGLPARCAGSDIELMHLESKYQLLSLYLWLSQHLAAEFFPQKEEAERMSLNIARLLGESLTKMHKEPFTGFESLVHSEGISTAPFAHDKIGGLG